MQPLINSRQPIPSGSIQGALAKNFGVSDIYPYYCCKFLSRVLYLNSNLIFGACSVFLKKLKVSEKFSVPFFILISF